MQFKQEIEKKSFSVKISYDEDGQEVGRVRLIVIYNDLHKQPFGLLEDLFVDEGKRGEGVRKALVEEVKAEAKKNNCYKLILTCRNQNLLLHKWYEKLGFKEHGKSFRIDF